jgi:hypothetical protein
MKKAWFFGVVFALVLLLVLRVGISLSNRPSDQVLIERALDEAIQASKEGRPGGVLDLLSANLKVNDQLIGASNREIANFVRDQKPDVKVLEPSARIIGEEGRIVSLVDLDLGILGVRRLKEVTMIFRREEATELVFIPTTKWRLVEVRVPDSTISDFMQ